VAAEGRKAGLRVEFTESVEESIRLNAIRHRTVIISASGMCGAGRTPVASRRRALWLRSPRSPVEVLYRSVRKNKSMVGLKTVL
jgi:hypothetical protein